MVKVLLISILASLGAAAVAWGLYLESFKEKPEFLDVEDFRSSARKSHSGQKWVFWGVITEMVIGFGIAIWEGHEILKSDPMNQPVTSLRVVLFVNLIGTNFDREWIKVEPNGNWSWSHNAQHNADGELVASNRRIAAMLGCESFEMNPVFMPNGTNFFMYSIMLSWPSPSPYVAQLETPPMAGHTTLLVLHQPPPTVNELEKELTGLSVRLPGLIPDGMSFTAQSSCVLMINGKTQIHFAIPTNISENAYTFFPVDLKDVQKQ